MITIACRKAWRVGIVRYSFQGIAVVDRADIIARRMTCLRQCRRNRGTKALVEPSTDGGRVGIKPIPAGKGKGHIILMVGAVGDMKIEIQDRVIFADQPDHGLHFGSICLEIFTVQIVILARRAPTLHQWPALVGAIGARGTLMPVDVENRYKHQIDLVEQAILVPEGDIAQQHEAGVLAIDFPRMDARLNKQNRLFTGRSFARDHGNHIPALRRFAEGLNAEQWRSLRHFSGKSDGRRIVRRFHETRFFARSCPWISGGNGKFFALPFPWSEWW